MVHKVISLFLSLVFLLFLLCALSHADEKIVKVATLIDYAPYCFADKDSEADQMIRVGTDAVGFQGYSWDVLRESFHEMGYAIHLLLMPWARAMSDFKAGDVDVLFPTGLNEQRQKIFNYSSESINSARFVVYVQADNAIEWDGLESLQGLTIGVKRGFNYGDKWASATGIVKQDISTIIQGFDMLYAGRLDGFLGYEYNWDYVLNQENWGDTFRKLPSFDSSAEYLVALKTNPRGIEYLEAFDKGKRRLAESGELEKIKNKWFGN